MEQKLKRVKLKGNESFNIREGWLRKGMRCVQEYPNLFAKENVMEILGVGSKMVKSIRFWLQAAGLTQETYADGGRSRIQTLSQFGQIIDEYDPFFDDIFTLYLIHANIVSNEELCIAWNIFFNEYQADSFTKDNMVEGISYLLSKKMEEGVLFSEKSLADDCASVLKMYKKDTAVVDPEENLNCPLEELGLVEKSNITKAAYKKSTPSVERLDKLAVLCVICNNMPENKSSISIDELLTGKNNVGRVFNLSRILLNEYIDQLRAAGYLAVNRTAGLNMVYFEKRVIAADIMKTYYEHARVR